MERKVNTLCAVADIKGSDAYPNLCGKAKFYQLPYCVLVEANIKGLPDNATGFFGFHIHEGTACSGEDFADTKAHYNPSTAEHPLHAGDLPPLIYCGGHSFLAVATNRFCVSDILGRTVVIHSMPDDFHTQPAGNAGTKIACGVIKRV